MPAQTLTLMNLYKRNTDGRTIYVTKENRDILKGIVLSSDLKMSGRETAVMRHTHTRIDN